MDPAAQAIRALARVWCKRVAMRTKPSWTVVAISRPLWLKGVTGGQPGRARSDQRMAFIEKPVGQSNLVNNLASTVFGPGPVMISVRIMALCRTGRSLLAGFGTRWPRWVRRTTRAGALPSPGDRYQSMIVAESRAVGVG